MVMIRMDAKMARTTKPVSVDPAALRDSAEGWQWQAGNWAVLDAACLPAGAVGVRLGLASRLGRMLGRLSGRDPRQHGEVLIMSRGEGLEFSSDFMLAAFEKGSERILYEGQAAELYPADGICWCFVRARGGVRFGIASAGRRFRPVFLTVRQGRDMLTALGVPGVVAKAAIDPLDMALLVRGSGPAWDQGE